jgi:hypothetical protein
MQQVIALGVRLTLKIGVRIRRVRCDMHAPLRPGHERSHRGRASWRQAANH